MPDPRLHRLMDIVPVHAVLAMQSHESSHSPFEPNDVLPFQAPPVREDRHAQKRYAPLRLEDAAFSLVQGKTKTLKISDDRRFGLPQEPLVVVKEDKIIHVTEIMPAPQPLFDEMIQSIELDVREKLGCQVTDRNSLSEKSLFRR